MIASWFGSEPDVVKEAAQESAGAFSLFDVMMTIGRRRLHVSPVS